MAEECRSSRKFFHGFFQIIFTLLFIISFVFISGCGGGGAGGGNGTGEISGVVRTVDGAPIEGATVTAFSNSITAITDANGNYTIPGVSSGEHLVTATKGGFNHGAIVVNVEEDEVAEAFPLILAPSGTKSYVGSSVCLSCHPDTATEKQTLHFLTLRAPGKPSGHQDLSRFPNADKGLIYFENETTFTDFSGLTGFTAILRKVGDTFQVVLSDGTNQKAYDVAFTQGGEGIWKQRYITRIGKSYYVLPTQYDEAQDEWVGYNPDRWFENGSLREPTADKSFDNNCTGCHFTGLTLKGNQAEGFQADAVNDPNGPLDYDGDGFTDEIHIGCENCHGAGSEHAGVGGDISQIINPDDLGFEEGNLVCGQCHHRGVGKGSVDGIPTEYPSAGSDDNIRFFQVGMNRDEFLNDFLEEEPGLWGDIAFGSKEDHSKSHHQQYQDFVKSRKYSEVQMRCWDCHDPHGSSFEHELRMNADDNTLCAVCHPNIVVDVKNHMANKVGMPLDPTPEENGVGRCTTCHMSKTAKSAGLWSKDEDGRIIQGDISSHTFEPVYPIVSQEMYDAIGGGTLPPATDIIPDSCSTCHDGIGPGIAITDFRYKP